MIPSTGIRLSIRFLLAASCLLWGGISTSFGQVVFKAETDARQVVENGVFNVEYTLENAVSNSFSPPDFTGFQVVSGPSRSQSTTVINGQMSQSMSFGYTLLAKKEGKYTISPATILVNGKRISSNTLSVEVVKPAPGSPDASQDIFLRAEVDSLPIYPGQQQYLYYKIYTQVNIRDYSTISEDRYDNFYFRYVKDFDRRPQRVVINGKQYTAQVIKTVALFPQKTGTFTIDPMVLNVWVPKPGTSGSRGFFRSYNHINKQVTSKPVTIQVLPLPAGAPGSFSGGVGSFRVFAAIDERKITTDDALVLQMRVIGNGDERRWTAPRIGLEDKFEVFEPDTKNERAIDQNGSIVAEKTFEYLLIPKETGTIRFTVPFSYFDPDSAKYITIDSRPFTIQVTEGTGTRESGNEEDVTSGERQEIQPFMANPDFSGSRKPFFRSPVFWFLAVLPFFLVGVIYYQERRKEAYLRLDPAKRKMLEAKKKAMEHLASAEKLKSTGSVKAYYEALGAAIFGYVSDKLGIPLADLSMSTIGEKVDTLGISADSRAKLMSLLSRCQFMVYGGGSGDGQREAFYEETLQLITSLETELTATM